MNIVEILEKTGRIELAELASLFLPDSVIGTKEAEFADGVCEEDSEECEGDKEEWMRRKLRNAIAMPEVD